MCFAGADLTIVQSNGETALHSAARRGDPAIIQRFLHHSTLLDARNTKLLTPLMVLLLSFRLQNRADMQEATEMLIAANADLNTVDQDGESALLMAVGLAITSDNNTVTYRVPACVCIRLIEAGGKYCLGVLG